MLNGADYKVELKTNDARLKNLHGQTIEIDGLLKEHPDSIYDTLILQVLNRKNNFRLKEN